MGEFQFKSLSQTLGEMLRRIQNPAPALDEIGFLMANEMKTNINVGGRPNTWPESIRAKNVGGKTLRDSGNLMNSITHEVAGTTVAAGPTAVGRQMIKDPRILGILAFGGVIRAKNKPFLQFPVPGGGWAKVKEVTMPERDFTYMPPEATVTFGEILSRYVVGGAAG